MSKLYLQILDNKKDYAVYNEKGERAATLIKKNGIRKGYSIIAYFDTQPDFDKHVNVLPEGLQRIQQAYLLIFPE